jgi:acyl-coenzyme A synthetase/AMP-(fatty) acid ligase
LIVSDPQTNDAPLHTNDLVELLPDGRFRILGRRDNVVCSGGIKLQIEEIEHKLAAVISVPFMLTYVSDERLGQALTMLYTGEALPSELHQLCAARVGRYEVPKHIFRVSSLPMTETGKPARSEAHRVAEECFCQL